MCAVLRRVAVAERHVASAYIVVEAKLAQPNLLQTELPINQATYVEAEARLSNIVNTLRKSIDFAVAFEEVMAQNKKLKRVLLVTATNSETQALWEVAEGMTHAKRTHLQKPNYYATEIGQINQVRLLHVLTCPEFLGPA